MPSTVAEAFDDLLSRIELNPTRVALASQRYNAVKQTIESALPGKEVRQIGSFQRSTKLRPRDLGDGLDIDAIVSFGDAHRMAPPGEGLTTRQAMERVRSGLRSNQTYRVMDPYADAPTVTLEYSDPDGFKIELVPVFVHRTGLQPPPGRPASYLVAKATDWEKADYDYDAALISNANCRPEIRGCLVPLIKIVKAYLRSRDVPVSSFHAEILTYLTACPAIQEWSQRGMRWGYQHALARVLADASVWVAQPVSLPGSLSLAVNSGLSANELQRIGQYLAHRAAEAWRLCGLADGIPAVRAWVRSGKGKKDRVVPVEGRAALALNTYLAEARPELVKRVDQALFLSRDGGRLSMVGLRAMVQRHGQVIGVHVSPHVLRHTCATHLLRGGASIRHVQELLGHRSLATTALYTRVAIEDLRRVLARAHPRR